MIPNNNDVVLKQLGIRWKAVAAYCEQVHLNATVEDWHYFVLGMEDLISNLKAILPPDTGDDDTEDDDTGDDDTDTGIAVADEANTNSIQFLSFRCFANAFPEYVKSKKPIRERYSQELKKQTIHEFATDHDRISMTLSNTIRRYEKSLYDV
jgi:hypothetical protein